MDDPKKGKLGQKTKKNWPRGLWMTPNTYLFSTVYLEIFVETQPKEEKLPNDAKEFVMTPQTVGNKNSATEKTDFNIQGRIDTTNVCIQEPLAGYSKHKQWAGSW